MQYEIDDDVQIVIFVLVFLLWALIVIFLCNFHVKTQHYQFLQ